MNQQIILESSLVSHWFATILHITNSSSKSFPDPSLFTLAEGKGMLLGEFIFFSQVCWSVMFVYLFVCLSHDFWPQFSSNRFEIFCLCRWPVKDSNAKFWWRSESGPDLRIFKVILRHWEIGSKIRCSTICQKVMDEFTRNLVDRFGVPLGRIDSILVKIRILIPIRELFNI